MDHKDEGSYDKRHELRLTLHGSHGEGLSSTTIDARWVYFSPEDSGAPADSSVDATSGGGDDELVILYPDGDLTRLRGIFSWHDTGRAGRDVACVLLDVAKGTWGRFDDSRLAIRYTWTDDGAAESVASARESVERWIVAGTLAGWLGLEIVSPSREYVALEAIERVLRPKFGSRQASATNPAAARFE